MSWFASPHGAGDLRVAAPGVSDPRVAAPPSRITMVRERFEEVCRTCAPEVLQNLVLQYPVGPNNDSYSGKNYADIGPKDGAAMVQAVARTMLDS